MGEGLYTLTSINLQLAYEDHFLVCLDITLKDFCTFGVLCSISILQYKTQSSNLILKPLFKTDVHLFTAVFR